MNDVVREKRKKIAFTTIIVMASIVILGTIFGIVDYFRSVSGKKPIFIYRVVNVSNIDINKNGVEYYGIGYKVSICDSETKDYTFQLGHKKKTSCFTSLNCSETYGAKNDKHSYEFSFFHDKLYQIKATYLVPTRMIENEKTFAKEYLNFNDVISVSSSVKKINKNTYELKQTCDLSKMSNSDIEKVCLIDYFDKSEIVELTKKRIRDNYHKDACK